MTKIFTEHDSASSSSSGDRARAILQTLSRRRRDNRLTRSNQWLTTFMTRCHSSLALPHAPFVLSPKLSFHVVLHVAPFMTQTSASEEQGLAHSGPASFLAGSASRPICVRVRRGYVMCCAVPNFVYIRTSKRQTVTQTSGRRSHRRCLRRARNRFLHRISQRQAPFRSLTEARRRHPR